MQSLAIQGQINIVEAGPGMGKSWTIINAVQQAISGWKTEKDQIIIVTFGNQLTNDLNVRLQEKGLTGVKAKTQHSFGLLLVREDPRLFRFTKAPTPMNEQKEQKLFEKEFSLYFGNKFPVSCHTVYKAYQNKGSKGRSVSKTLRGQRIGKDKIESINKFLSHYHKVKRQSNLIGFDDMVRLPLRKLNDPEFAAKIAHTYKFLAVDEYQDMNYQQRQLIQRLAQVIETSIIVGDDLQSIYSFRGASPSAMQEIKKQFPEAHHWTLEKSYRLSEETAEFVELILRYNRYSTRIQGTNDGPKPRIVSAISRNHMCTNALKTIQQLHKDGADFTDIAVLAPEHKTLHTFALYLQAHNIPHTYQPKTDPTPIFKDLELFIRSIDPEDTAAVRDLLMKKAGINPRQAQALAQLDLDQRIPAQKLKLTGEQHDLVRKYRKAIKLVRDANHIDRVLIIFSSEFQGKKAYKPSLSIKHVLRVAGIHPFTTTEDLQKQLQEYLQNTTENNQQATGGVMVSTIHGAKGGEWDNVLVLDVHDKGLLRDKRGKVDHEAQFRLFFVAITRPKQRLHLFTLKHEAPYSYIELKEDQKLSFLNEKAMDKEYLPIRYLPAFMEVEKYCEYERCEKPKSS